MTPADVFATSTAAELFLPPANEVSGRVIFSQACVKNSVHREVVSGPGRVPGPGGCLVPGVGLVPEGSGDPPPRTATAAGGTHPTGMHSSDPHTLHICTGLGGTRT